VEKFTYRCSETEKNLFLNFDGKRLECKIQDGAIKENGVNGCQIDEVIEFCKEFITYHNNKFPCRENSITITKLDEALHWLKHRTERRIKEKTEGTSKEIK